jgi:hypothetical protein
MDSEDSVSITTKIKIDAYKIISESVENGVRYGLNRAHKYAEKPTNNDIIEQIHGAVMASLCEILKFDE